MSGVSARFLQVKALCEKWFPVEYAPVWFEDITSNKKFFSLAACRGNEIVGLVVAELKTHAQLNKEVRDRPVIPSSKQR